MADCLHFRNLPLKALKLHGATAVPSLFYVIKQYVINISSRSGVCGLGICRQLATLEPLKIIIN
jgi:hypothetical protein